MASVQGWETMADEIQGLVKEMLTPRTYHPMNNSVTVRSHYIQSSIAAAHWLQLCKTFLLEAHPWRQRLSHHRRCHLETAACCRVLEIRTTSGRHDWPLEVLRLRGSREQLTSLTLSPATPLSRSALRAAYRAVAKEVHPDRTCVPLAHQAMSVVNEVRHLKPRPYSLLPSLLLS